MTIRTYTNYLDDYLIENKRRNHVADQHKLRRINKAAATFDPLTAQEPDANDVTLDLLAEESECGVLVNKSRAKSSDNYTDTVAILDRQTSDTTLDKELVLIQKMGLRLYCKNCGDLWVYSGKLDASRYMPHVVVAIVRSVSSHQILQLPVTPSEGREPSNK
ncbi:MAG: hypothetical protein WBP64_10915 [Nitrososphaeraceae archaeon]